VLPIRPLQCRPRRHHTRPYRPQTNGKIERFHRTLAFEWSYDHHYDSEQARAATYQDWIHDYNHHKPHTGIGGKSPIDRVHSVNGQDAKDEMYVFSKADEKS